MVGMHVVMLIALVSLQIASAKSLCSFPYINVVYQIIYMCLGLAVEDC